MSYCINPKCPKPADPLNAFNRVCRQCGSPLLLQGRYRVIRILGEGGFAKTYEVEDRGQPKVLKVLLLNEPKAVMLFEKEAEVLSHLRHLGIPRVDPDGYFTYLPNHAKQPLHCLVMEKIEGINLEEWLNLGNLLLTEQQALDWLQQLGQILHQVHRQQYFHRDIKPANIMLRPNGQLVLIDFGTVRQVTGTYLAKMGIGQKGTIIASKGYAPTEQENGKPVPQSDFFALGRTFVHLLTGQHPLDFYDGSTDELRWRASAPHITPQFADFIDDLMARLPGRRPQSTEVILQRLAQMQQALQRSVKKTQRSRQWISRLAGKQRLLGAVAVAVLGFVGMTQVNFYQPFHLLGVAKNLELKPVLPPITSDRRETPLQEQRLQSTEWSDRSSGTRLASTTQPSKPNPIVLAKTLVGHSEDVRSVTMSPDSKLLASGSFDGTIKIWNLQTGEVDRTLSSNTNEPEIISSVAIGSDGRTLASGSFDGTIQIWNLNSGELIETFPEQPEGITVVAIAPNGKILASGSEDGTIQLWQIQTGQRLATLSGHLGKVFTVAFSPNSQQLASGGQDGTIHIWNLGTAEGATEVQSTPARILSDHVERVLSVAFSPNGQKLASGSGDNTIKLWNLKTGEVLGTLPSYTGTVYSVAFSPAGEMLASGSLTGAIDIWDLTTGKLLQRLLGHTRWVESVAFSPDGSTLASGSGDRTIKIWRFPPAIQPLSSE